MQSAEREDVEALTRRPLRRVAGRVCAQTCDVDAGPRPLQRNAMSCDSDASSLDATAGIPVWAPVVVAFFASGVRGVTGFADGLMAQCLFALLGSAGIMPATCSSLRKAVLYSTIMQAVTLPLQAWATRHHLRQIAGYLAAMTSLGAFTVYAGAWLLLSDSAATLRVFAGAFFCLVSALQLSVGARAWLREREKAEAAAAAAAVAVAVQCAAATPGVGVIEPGSAAFSLAPPASRADSSGAIAAVAEWGAAASASAATAAFSAASFSPALLAAQPDGGSTVPSSAASASVVACEIEMTFTEAEAAHAAASKEGDEGEGKLLLRPSPAPSPAPSPLRAGAAAAALGSLPAAVLAETSATFSPAPAPDSTTTLPPARPPVTSSPASCCAPREEFFPAISPVLSPMPLLLVLVAASLCAGVLNGMLGAGGPPLMLAYSFLDLDKDVLRGFGVVPSVFMALRLTIYMTSPGTVFDPSGEWPTYLFITAAAFFGSWIGGALRSRCSGPALLRAILALVWLSGGTMLGVLSEAVPTALFFSLTFAWLGGLWWLATRGARRRAAAAKAAVAASAAALQHRSEAPNAPLRLETEEAEEAEEEGLREAPLSPPTPRPTLSV